MRLTVGVSPALMDLMAFLDEVDWLCEQVPEWHPDRERIERIKQHALRLCQQAIEESKDASPGPDNPPAPSEEP